MLGLILALAALLAIRLIWGWEANHRLTKVLAELRAKGVRLDPPAANVPDDQNAALAVMKAMDAVQLTRDERKVLEDGDNAAGAFVDIAWSDAQKPEVHRILTKNAEAFQWMQTAAQRPAAHWPVTAAGVFYSGDHPIYHTRLLADLLYDAAICAHEDHDDRGALDNLALVIHLSRILDADPAEMSHLLAGSIRALGAAGVERLEPDLRLTERDSSLPAAYSLLGALSLADETACAAHARAWEAELDPRDDRLAQMYPGHWQWWARPLLIDDNARRSAYCAQDVPSVRADNWPAAKSLLPAGVDFSASHLDEITHFEAPTGGGGSAMYSNLNFRNLASSRAAILLIAARIYQSGRGYLPAKADDLMPTIISRTPVDPFAADHRPMCYRLDPDGPSIWSVGKNGTDEGGDGLPPDFRTGGYISRPLNRFGGSSRPAQNPPDAVFGSAWRDALRKTKPPPASTAPAPFPGGFPSVAPLPGAPAPPAPPAPK